MTDTATLEEKDAEIEALREALKTLTSHPRVVFMGWKYIRFEANLRPEHAEELLSLAWPEERPRISGA